MVCREGLDDATTERCRSVWNHLRSGRVAEVPLATRCSLAAEIAEAAVDALNLSGSAWQLDARPIRSAVVVGAGEPGAPRLIGDAESCPRATVNPYYPPPGEPSSIDVEFLGAITDTKPVDLALRLLDARVERCPCMAVFGWPLDESPAALVTPHAELPREAPVVPAPTLVVAIDVASNGEFVMAGKSLEVP